MLHKELFFLCFFIYFFFYVKAVIPLAFNLLFQNCYLLGVIMNSKKRPQN